MVTVWDRAADTVEIDGKAFDRKKGPTFILIRPKDGTVSVHQVANVVGKDYAEILESIKKEAQDLEVIQSLQLAKTSNP